MMGCEFSKLYNLEIHLENDLGIFEPLDVVAGHILIQVENDTSIHHCLLTLRGLAHYAFSDTNSKHKCTIPNKTIEDFQIIFSKTEDLLSEYKINDNIYLNEPKEDMKCTPEFIITKGLHVFNFEFQLPAYLPASFGVPDIPEAECLQAFIVYNIKVEIVNIAQHVSHSRERDILVFRSLDLTQYPKLKDKITLRKEFSILECCASNSKVQCELTVNKCAFVPGEILTVDVLIKNGSARPIESVQLSLFQNINTKSEKNQKSIQLRLFSIGMGSVSPHRAHNFNDSIHIPPVVASGLIGCEILDVSYHLIAQLFVFGDKSKKKDKILKIPITIGSDPVKDASFGDNKEVVPCYALFDYETGAVIEYVPMKVSSSIHRMLPVYRYYKPAPSKLITRSLSRFPPSLSQSTIHLGQSSSLTHSLSSLKLADKLFQNISHPILPTDSETDTTQPSKDTYKHNSIEKYNFDRLHDAPSLEPQDSFNMHMMDKNGISSFNYYLSEESSDVTESIW